MLLESDDVEKLHALASFQTVFTKDGFEFARLISDSSAPASLHVSAYWQYSGVAQLFIKTCYERDVVLSFNWSEWMNGAEAQQFLDKPDTIGSATPIQLYKLVTTAIRADRFNDGAIKQAFDTGLLAAISRRAEDLLRKHWYRHSSWTEEYYSAIEHYFWEPNWLGYKSQDYSVTKSPSKPKKTLQQIMEGLRTSEVVLNHMFNVLLSLAPSQLVGELVFDALPSWQPEPLTAHVRPRLPHKGVPLCQPDVLLVGKRSIIALEMKIKAKTSPEQVAKYALFSRHYGLDANPPTKTAYLIYLTPQGYQGWGHAANLSDLTRSLLHLEPTGNLKRFVTKYRYSAEDVRSIISAQSVAHMTYDALAAVLVSARERLTRDGGSDETLRRLLGGFVNELLTRGLLIR